MRRHQRIHCKPDKASTSGRHFDFSSRPLSPWRAALEPRVGSELQPAAALLSFRPGRAKRRLFAQHREIYARCAGTDPAIMIDTISSRSIRHKRHRRRPSFQSWTDGLVGKPLPKEGAFFYLKLGPDTGGQGM